jgi:hypothetical protein
MNSKLNQQYDHSAETSANGNSDYFNFDLWASEVRRQMLALLQKKGSPKEPISSRKNNNRIN